MTKVPVPVGEPGPVGEAVPVGEAGAVGRAGPASREDREGGAVGAAVGA